MRRHAPLIDDCPHEWDREMPGDRDDVTTGMRVMLFCAAMTAAAAAAIVIACAPSS